MTRPELKAFERMCRKFEKYFGENCSDETT